MSDKSIALDVIAKIADVEVSQLPSSLSPSDFSASDWQAVLEYATAVDIRESLVGVYQRSGANTICPKCHRYARGMFFERGSRSPSVFRCEYDNTVWYNSGADEGLVDRTLRRYNASLWYEKG